jgi:uncharacterized protein (TIGR00290 family)
MTERIVLYWSGGKDCAYVLHDLQNAEHFKDYRVSCLLTTLTEGYDRVSGHGLRRSLLERQAASLGLMLHKTYIPRRATMAQYETVMEKALAAHRSQGVRVASSGDIFVEKQRVATFKKMGFKGCFPLWKRTTHEQIRAFLDSGLKAYIICVDSAKLGAPFVGRVLDAEFLAELPPYVDPCGEHGEFHTFVYDGPMFREPIRCKFGQVVLRESHYFCDLLLNE